MSTEARTRLAAIMFTDVVGYSRYMAENEITALKLLEDHNNLLFPLIEQYEGKLVKSIGDALLVDFSSVRHACECALAIQKVLNHRNERGGQELLIRIGIHLGDIWYTENDVFGDGVNIASRLEALAAPGGIVVSGDVYRQISNKLTIPMHALGKRELKNISNPVELYELETGCEKRGDTGSRSGSESAKHPANNENDELKQKILELADMGLTNAFGSGRAAGATAASSGAAAGSSSGDDASCAGASSVAAVSLTDDPGIRVKTKLMSAADKFMDKAIKEWEKQPQEKKDKIIAGIRSEISSEISAELAGELGFDCDGKKKKKDSVSDAAGEVGFGLAVIIGTGFAFFTGGSWFWLIGLGLIGVPTFTGGLAKLFRRRESSQNAELTRAGGQAAGSVLDQKAREKAALHCAREYKGRITVLQLAGSSELSIDESKEILEYLAANDYARLNVDENGLLYYEFHEFLELSAE